MHALSVAYTEKATEKRVQEEVQLFFFSSFLSPSCSFFSSFPKYCKYKRKSLVALSALVLKLSFKKKSSKTRFKRKKQQWDLLKER